MVEIGGLLHAIPLLDIREIAPRPDVLLPFPAAQSNVIGAMDMRGALIPVFDTAKLLSLEEDRAAKQVVVLRLGGGVAGFVVGDVRGVWSINPDQMTVYGLSDGGGAGREVIAAGFCHPEGDGFVLDPGALAQSMAFKVAAVRRVDRGDVQRGDPAIKFSAGPAKLVIDARAVVAMAPSSEIEASPVGASVWSGFIRHVGRRIPIVDTLQLLGLGSYPTASSAASIIIRLTNGAMIAMRLDGVEDMVRLADGAIGPMGALPNLRHELFGGLYKGDGTSLVLNAAALQSDVQLSEIGMLEARRAESDVAVAVAPRESFLRFALSETVFAVPLGQVDELIRTPEAVLGGCTGDGKVVHGLVSHRGRAIPFIDIRREVGLGGGGIGSFAILVSVGDGQVAITADRLVSVERLAVRSLAPKAASDEPDLLGTTVVASGAACPVLDLRKIAAPWATQTHVSTAA